MATFLDEEKAAFLAGLAFYVGVEVDRLTIVDVSDVAFSGTSNKDETPAEADYPQYGTPPTSYDYPPWNGYGTPPSLVIMNTHSMETTSHELRRHRRRLLL